MFGEELAHRRVKDDVYPVESEWDVFEADGSEVGDVLEHSREVCETPEAFGEEDWQPEDAQHRNMSLIGPSAGSRQVCFASCLLCSAGEWPLQLGEPPFCAELHSNISPWDRAVARANRIAAQLGLVQQQTEQQNRRGGRSTKARESPSRYSTFEELCDLFLKVHG